ncbi:MAG: hypothetical protein U0U67_06175 [Chitinophagales bacterium]
MKTIKYIAIIAAAYCFCFFTNSCKKTTEVKPDPIDTTIGKEIPKIYNYTTLLGQPLDTVKSYLNGKWLMQSKQGGMGLSYYSYTNLFVEFIFNSPNPDSLKWYNDTKFFVNGRATFINHQATYDSTWYNSYEIKFMILPSSPGFWFATQANKDSLYLVDANLEGYKYFLTKVH